MEPTEKEVNQYLKRFGSDIKGSQLFRVSWSSSQTEVRKRTYNEFSGKLFLRTVTDTSTCLKYPLIKDKWILEKLIPPDPSYTSEIVSAKENGSYECIYVFQDKGGNYLSLNTKVAEIIVKAITNPGSIGKRTDSSESAQHQEEKKEESLITEDIMNLYEELMKKDKKFPDGSNANKDGSFYMNDPKKQEVL